MTHTSKDVVAAVRGLARLCTDDVIASVLNRNGLRTGRGNRWTRERVVSLRSWHEIPCHSSERGFPCCHSGRSEESRSLSLGDSVLADERG